MKKKKLSDMLISMYKYGGNLEEPPSDRLRRVNSDDELKRIEAIEKAKKENERLERQEATERQGVITYPKGDYLRNAHPGMVNLTNIRNNEQLENWAQQALPKSVGKALGYIAGGRGVAKGLSGGKTIAGKIFSKEDMRPLIGLGYAGLLGYAGNLLHEKSKEDNQKMDLAKQNSFNPLFDFDELYNKKDSDTVGYIKNKPITNKEFMDMSDDGYIDTEYSKKYKKYLLKKLTGK